MSEQRLIDAGDVKREVEKALRWHSGYPNCGEYDYAYECAMRDATKKIRDVVDRQPTIEPTTPQWISVEDGLPEEKVSVLVAYIGRNDKKVYTDGCARLDGGWRWTLDDDDVNVEITHWMPLPEPPEGGNT